MPLGGPHRVERCLGVGREELLLILRSQAGEGDDLALRRDAFPAPEPDEQADDEREHAHAYADCGDDLVVAPSGGRQG